MFSVCVCVCVSDLINQVEILKPLTFSTVTSKLTSPCVCVCVCVCLFVCLSAGRKKYRTDFHKTQLEEHLFICFNLHFQTDTTC